MVGIIVATLQSGCSLYPIPDNVTGLRTEEIVRHGRCELRSAVINLIAQDEKKLAKIFAAKEINDGMSKWFESKKITSPTKEQAIVAMVATVNAIVEDQQEKNQERFNKVFKRAGSGLQLKRALTKLSEDLRNELAARLGGAQDFRKYLDVAVVYEFDFEITEQNTIKGEAAFKLPLLSKAVDVDASAQLLLTRKGKRTLKAQDKWGKLIVSDKLCDKYSVRGGNGIYPLGGSIGVGRVAETYSDLIVQGGTKESFVDVLVFTTDASGGANAAIKINPVPDVFRLVSAGVHGSGSRVDIHKLTMSFVLAKEDSTEAVYGIDRFDGELDTPFSRPADWRARYNLCVADARAREEAFKALRLNAPELYCVNYADAFDYKYGAPDQRKPMGAMQEKRKGAPKHVVVPPPTILQRRPNFIPLQ